MNKKTIKDIDLKGKRIIVRVDFNVPLDKSLKITDDRRIREALPTIQFLLKNNAAKVILMSHLGRPAGKPVDSMRLKPVGVRLEELLKEKVLILDDCIGEATQQKVNAARERLVLLENLRFYKEEEKNDVHFAKELSKFADIYVNDAFGTAHRAHASTDGITKYLPSVAGFLLEKEINYLDKAVRAPKKPFVVILGGAKVSDKILMIESMLPKADSILIGGGMAYTFLKAQGKAIGNSKLEADKVDVAKKILEMAKAKNVSIVLPVDHVVTEAFDSTANLKIVSDIPEGWLAVDIGPKTIKNFQDILAKAKTIVWNGPVGVFENDAFARGTKEIAEFIGNLKDCVSIIGGGDTAAAMSKFKIEDRMTHISTGGGAALEYLEGKTLPGIAALNDKSSKKNL